LGVVPGATLAEIKTAYRKLAARYHPDKHRDNVLSDLAKEKLAEINEAYDILKDKNRRAVYDRERQVNSSRPSARRDAPQTLDSAAMLRSMVRFIVVLLVVFFALRFIRSPRALLVIGIAILIAWFLPRVIRKFRGRK
jgi:curved DNA-binding protein CbpA